MISGLRQNPCATTFKRDVTYDECDALQKRNPEVLFDIGYKIGSREIRTRDGALDTLDMRSFTPFYKHSVDAAYFNPNINQEHTSESFLQIVKTLLRTPMPDKKSVPVDVATIRGFIAGHPKTIAQSGFCQGCGAFDPHQVTRAIDDLRRGGVMFFNGTAEAFKAFEKKNAHLESIEPTKLQIFLAGFMHNFRP